MTKHFGVAGSPIGQSLSPNLHRAAFAFLQRDADYERFEVASDLEGYLSLQQPKVDGLSVTMPLKEEALQLAEWLDEQAVLTGSCNTLVRRSDSWVGYNTDVIGLQRALASVESSRVLIIGSGATSRSALVAARIRGDDVTCWARSTANLSDNQHEAFSESAITRLSDFDLVVSTIPLSPFFELLTKSNGLPTRIFSAAYHPSFVAGESPISGAEWIDGKEMLLWQAVAQQALFFSLEPEAYLENDELVAVMRASLERPVGE